MWYDCHMHTLHSDGRSTVQEMCTSAVDKGMCGITITDHADMNFYNDRDTLNRIKSSIADITACREEFNGKLKVLRGVELGEYTYSPQKAEEILALECYDAILCSVHLVPKAGWSLAYNRIDFSNPSITDDDINEYLKLYFDLLSDTIDCFDFDILSHIQCPARYMTGRYKRKTDIMLFSDKITEIMEKIISRNIALEVNTGVLSQDYENANLQTVDILKLYKSLGGKMLTLGSDAHVCGSVAGNFPSAAKVIKACGFDKCYYFENRKPVEYLL